jgi:hypothetical protein
MKDKAICILMYAQVNIKNVIDAGIIVKKLDLTMNTQLFAIDASVIFLKKAK